jgi:hypothetical protein
MAFSEIAASLTWPRLLESGRLALRPARMGLSLMVLVLIGLIGQLPRLWLKDAKPGAGPLGMAAEGGSDALIQIGNGVKGLNHLEVGHGLEQLFVHMPRSVLVAYPWSTLAIFIPILLVWAIGGGAISRMAATEFSLDRPLGWTRGLAFALSRIGSLAASIAAPIIIVGLIVGLMAIVGWGLLSVPIVQVIGAVLFGLALLAGAAAVLTLVAYFLGMPMLIPAVTCEGTDAIDAIQRCYAYVTGRPLRLVLYWAVLIIQGAVVTLILALLARMIVNLTTWSATLLVHDPLGQAIRDTAAAGMVESTVDLSQGGKAVVSISAFWIQIPMLLVASFVISYWFSAGTVLYLLTRQVCDGQDAGELWTPGMIAGTHAPSEPAGPEDDEDE